jgi:hypothetical protein
MSLRYWFNPKEVYVDVRYMVRYRIPATSVVRGMGGLLKIHGASTTTLPA